MTAIATCPRATLLVASGACVGNTDSSGVDEGAEA